MTNYKIPDLRNVTIDNDCGGASPNTKARDLSRGNSPNVVTMRVAIGSAMIRALSNFRNILLALLSAIGCDFDDRITPSALIRTNPALTGSGRHDKDEIAYVATSDGIAREDRQNVAGI